MIHGSCHCGAIALRVARKPDYLNSCHCSICYKYGTLWGYYSPADVDLCPRSGDLHTATERYRCHSQTVDFVRCRECGCVLCWTLRRENPPKMGVNMRLVPEAEVEGVEVRQEGGPE